MSKHLEKSDQPRGRFDGDALVILRYHPSATHRWEVQIFTWCEFTSKAHQDGYEDGWRDEHRTFGVLIGEKRFYGRGFKRLDRAVRYYHKVSAQADIEALWRVQRTRVEEAAETVLASAEVAP